MEQTPDFDEFFRSLTAHDVEFVTNTRASGHLEDLTDIEALGEKPVTPAGQFLTTGV
jgi:hypothetical protein